MSGIVTGFAVIAVIVLVGYITGRAGILGAEAERVMAKLVFYVLSPFLLLTVLADSDVALLFSPLLGVSLLAALSAFALFASVAVLVWRRPVPETTIGAMAAGYVNSNNIGIPVSAYVLGDAAYSAPVVLMQLLLFTPAVLTLLDVSTGARPSLGRILLRPLTNPIIIGSALGLLLSVTEYRLPTALMEPIRLIGAAAVPVILISFGMSLHGQRILRAGSGRRDVVLASVIKLAFMPITAWLIGRYWFGLDGASLFAVVVLAALPTAQNVFNFAQLYGRGVIVARDAALITTVGSVGALLVASALLH